MTLNRINNTILKSESGNSAPAAYKSSNEHLADEFRKIDALIHLQVLKLKKSNSGNGSNEFAGLFIPEEEIDAILNPADDCDSSPLSVKKTEIDKVSGFINKIKTIIKQKTASSIESGICLPLCQISYLFHLEPFELDVLLLCLAPEVDVKYKRLYAYLHDDVTKKNPSVRLIMDLLCTTTEERNMARLYFLPQSPLCKYYLLRVEHEGQDQSLISMDLKLDDRIINFLLGYNVLDSALSSFTRVLYPREKWSEIFIDDSIKESFRSFSKKHILNKTRDMFVFYFCGPYGAGKKLTAEAICHDVQLPLVFADMRDIIHNSSDFEILIILLFREVLLQSAALYIEHFDELFANSQSMNGKELYYQNIVIRSMIESSFLTFLAGEQPWNLPVDIKKHAVIQMEFPVPPFAIRKQVWKKYLNRKDSLFPGVNPGILAQKFQLTGGQIIDAINQAGNLAMIRDGRDSGIKITMEDLYKSCQNQSQHKLKELARKIIPQYRWPDIILPPDNLKQLSEICNYVKYHYLVYHTWGFGRKVSLGKGLNALFSGPSGTGKTMAAEIIAGELKIELYKIDLSCIVSKYIGETEKNISRIFQEAEICNVILFFDEADALFGKRSEVKDSHDRYANIEINYLLQKMEEHEGIVFLATNLHRNIDDAFARRMHFTVNFPFPDEEYRLLIWRNIFPGETPLHPDIDLKFLAKRFKISGGNIKNVALQAAFLAAGDDEVPGNSTAGGSSKEARKEVRMEDIIQAIKREYQKMGKLCVESDFGKYYDLVMPRTGEQ